MRKRVVNMLFRQFSFFPAPTLGITVIAVIISHKQHINSLEEVEDGNWTAKFVGSFSICK